MDYNNYLNPTLVSIKPSGIRKFFSIAEEMDNVISLGVGEPDFKTPVSILLNRVLQDILQMQVFPF